MSKMIPSIYGTVKVACVDNDALVLGIASLLFLEIVYYLGTNLSNFEKFVILNFD